MTSHNHQPNEMTNTLSSYVALKLKIEDQFSVTRVTDTTLYTDIWSLLFSQIVNGVCASMLLLCSMSGKHVQKTAPTSFKVLTTTFTETYLFIFCDFHALVCISFWGCSLFVPSSNQKFLSLLSLVLAFLFLSAFPLFYFRTHTDTFYSFWFFKTNELFLVLISSFLCCRF